MDSTPKVTIDKTINETQYTQKNHNFGLKSMQYVRHEYTAGVRVRIRWLHGRKSTT